MDVDPNEILEGLKGAKDFEVPSLFPAITAPGGGSSRRYSGSGSGFGGGRCGAILRYRLHSCCFVVFIIALLLVVLLLR